MNRLSIRMGQPDGPVERTESGWRRVRHEKIIPNQVLAVDGKSVISPPLGLAKSLSAKRP